MQRRSQRAFLLLIALQATHSIEEYAARLYDVLAPARFVSSLVSDDLAVGFAVVNTAFVVFGLWCYFVPIRSGRPSARVWAWLWAIVELANGVLHSALALSTGGYFPGAVTAPLLFVVAAGLVILLRRE